MVANALVIPSTHRSLLLERPPISCLLNSILHSRLPYWSTSSKYFAPFLKPRHSVYNTHKGQAYGVFLEVPHFATSVDMSTENFCLSFAYDAPKIWNDFSDDVHSATSLHSFRNKLKTYLFEKAYPP